MESEPRWNGGRWLADGPKVRLERLACRQSRTVGPMVLGSSGSGGENHFGSAATCRRFPLAENLLPRSKAAASRRVPKAHLPRLAPNAEPARFSERASDSGTTRSDYLITT